MISLYLYVMTSLDDAVTQLRAAAESTRLRILSLLRDGELTVSDICAIIGHSQPRISRHLKILTDAGLLDRHREGSWIYYRHAATLPPAVTGLIDAIDTDDEQLTADTSRRDAERARRRADADEHFSRLAPIWDQERSRFTPDDDVETALLALLNGPDQPRYRAMVDLGTGTGRMLNVLRDRVERAVGIDSNHNMLRLARAALDGTDATIELRQGDVSATGLPENSFDLVIAHQILHFLDSPETALREAARIITSDGHLVIVDLLAHNDEALRTEHAHRRLGFTTEQLSRWCTAVGLTTPQEHHIAHSTSGLLPVCLWTTQPLTETSS